MFVDRALVFDHLQCAVYAIMIRPIGVKTYSGKFDSLTRCRRRKGEKWGMAIYNWSGNWTSMIFEIILDQKRKKLFLTISRHKIYSWRRVQKLQLRRRISPFLRSCHVTMTFIWTTSSNVWKRSESSWNRSKNFRWILQIRTGESYELCLTNRVDMTCHVDPLQLHKYLRRTNPAPCGAFLHYNDGFSVVSCSPEKFLTVDKHGKVTSKPIKGTARRGEILL